jgi:ubiquinone/menaquinone biosynthesis C-methylase UbiE
MIAEGRRQNELMKVTNIEYHSGDVEQLPYADKTFDLVVSRFAFHHFARPAEVLNQMKRVCKAKGSVGVIDMISSEDDYLFQQYNHYETLRDPSHTNALKQSQIMNLFHENDLEITVCETLAVQVHVDRWLELTKTDDETSQLIKNNLHEEISGKPIISGMSPFMQDNELMFKQKWVKIVGKRK